MSKVNLVWACSSHEAEYIVSTAEDGTELVEKLYDEGPCRWMDLQRDTLLDYVQLGLKYGWQPVGTVLMDIKTFVFHPLQPGMDIVASYDPAKLAEFKLVRRHDAAAWAAALEQACAALEAGSAEFAFTKGERTFTESMTPREFDRLNHPGLRQMREFVEFLKKGPFEFFYDD